MRDFDDIISMEWSLEYHAAIDWAENFDLNGSSMGLAITVISTRKAQRVMGQDCQGFLTSIATYPMRTRIKLGILGS